MELVPNTGRDYRAPDKDRVNANPLRLVQRNETPEHRFEAVKGQTGCARCGYARGHHPAIVSKQFRDTRTGEIVTQVPLSQIRYFEEV